MKAALAACGLGTCAVKCVKAPSGVSEQPVGRDAIRRGASNRLNACPKDTFRMSAESGVTVHGGEVRESTCVAYRTPLGVYEAWTSAFDVPKDVALAWLERQKADGSVTVGQVASELYAGVDPKDWYPAHTGGRAAVIQQAMERVIRLHLADAMHMPSLPAPLIDHKDVAFLDIGDPLAKCPREMLEAMTRLLRGLSFNKLVGVQSRGFLGLEEMAAHFPGVEAVMARTAGKLPGDSLVWTGKYAKEYKDGSTLRSIKDQLLELRETLGPVEAAVAVNKMIAYVEDLERETEDKGLGVQRHRFESGDRLVVIDDLGATWGTTKALVDMFHREFDNVRVVAVVTPYVVVDDQGRLLGPPPVPEARFAWTHRAAAAGCPRAAAKPHAPNDKPYVYMSDPDTEAWLAALGEPVSGLTRGRFAYSSNVWFKPERVRGKRVLVVVNTSADKSETALELLQMMLILHRHDARSVTVVAPFIEQSTQERVEESADGRSQTLAQADTMLALLSPPGSGRRVVTFDMHDVRTRFSGDNVKGYSLMDRLLRLYFEENPDAVPVFPDAGAAKRFGPTVAKYSDKTPVVFDKVRRDKKLVLSTLCEALASGTTYVLIDDMVRSGGTLGGVWRILVELWGAAAVDVCFVHAPLDAKGGMGLQMYRKVYFTDTVRNPPTDIPPRVSWLDLAKEELHDQP